MTRGRYKVVCSFCRKRKIKCDKKSPCTACVKMGNPHCDAVVKADSSSGDVADALRHRIAVLEKQLASNGMKPAANMEESLLNETMGFHDAISRIDHRNDQSWRYMGPFKWVVMVSIDEILLCIFKSFYACRDRPPFHDEAPHFYLNPLDKEIGLFHKPTVKGEHETLRMKLYDTLPSVRAINMLLDRFFKIAYPYMPILDEQDFRLAVGKLIGAKLGDDQRAMILGNGETDPAVYGLLLVALRTAYITLTGGSNQTPSYCFHNSKEELEYLSRQRIGADFIDLANQCLSVYNMTGDVCLEAFQLVTALRVYSTIAPEHTRYDIKSTTLSSLLNQIAYSLWINREWRRDRPDFDEKRDLLQKKLWYTLVFLEIDQSLFSGNYMAIGPDTFDAELPAFKPEFLTGFDPESEKMAIENIHWLEGYRGVLTEGINLTGKVSGNIKISVLEKVIQKLETAYDSLLNHLHGGKSTPSLTTKESFFRFSKLKLMLSQHYFIVGIYSHLIYYYTRKKEFYTASQWRYKVVHKLTTFLFPLLPDLVNQTMTIVSGSTDVFICGPLIQCLARCSLFIVSAMVRYSHVQRALESQHNHRVLLETSAEYQDFFTEIQKHRKLLRFSNQVVLNVYELMKDKYESARRFSLITKKVTDSSLPTEFVLRDRLMKAGETEVNGLRQCNVIMEQCMDDPAITALANDYSSTLPTSSTTSEIPTEMLWQSGSLSPFERYFDIILMEEMTRNI